MAMKLDHDDLDRLIEKISKSDIQEFSLEGEDFKLEIKRNLFDKNHSSNNLTVKNSLEKQKNSSPATSSDNIPLTSNNEASQVAPPGRPGLTDITSPMVCLLYTSDAADE